MKEKEQKHTGAGKGVERGRRGEGIMGKLAEVYDAEMLEALEAAIEFQHETP